jgi:alpha-glucosidase (family GH31 glycosyl hydrolase)
MSSNGMDVLYGDRGDTLEFRVIGGIPDVYFFAGPTPAAVVSQYLEVIGKPFLPPMWSLGFHQCRWGYKSISETKQVVDNYRKANIPLDTMWNDIDYMDKYRDFTFDPVNFNISEVQAFVQELHSRGQK